MGGVNYPACERRKIMQTVKKSIGQGFGKGELYEFLAYNPNDRYGGKAIKQLGFNPESGKTAITIGDSTTAITLATYAQRAISIYTTCASTDGSNTVLPVYINAIMSGTGGVGRALEAKLTVTGKLGSWGNALKGYTDLTGGTGCTGLVSAICAEMKMPATTAKGTHSVLEIELVTPASAVIQQGIGSNCTSFIRARVSGNSTAVQSFNDYGYFLDLQGLTSASTDLFDGCTLKCAISSTKYYLLLSTATASFTTAYPIVTTYAGGTAISNGTLATPIAMTTTSSDRVVISFSTTIPTDYSTGLYAYHVTAGDAPAGGVQGVVYGRTTVKHTIQDAYGVRGRMNFAPDTPVAESANLLVGVMANAGLDNAGFNTTVADSIKGLDASVTQTATSALVTGSIRAIYADISGIKVDNSGRTQGVYIKQGGGGDSYPDYGLFCHLESNNLLSAVIIKTFTSCVAPVGIQFTADTGSITALMDFSGTATYFIDLNDASGAGGTITSDSGSAATTWKARIKVRTDDGSDSWINVYSTSNE